MAEYYMLDKAHRALFTPFLYPSDREDPELRVLGAVQGRLAIGAMAVDAAGGGGAVLRSVAVSPEWQRRGVALGMLHEARTVLPQLGCESLRATLAPDLPGREPAEALLAKAGFQLAGEAPAIAECPLSAFLESPALRPFLGKRHPGVVPLGQIPRVSLKKLTAGLMQGGHLALPLDWQRFSPTLSFCGMPDGTNVTCCVCLRRWEKGVYVEWVYTRPASTRTMMEAIAAAVSSSVEECGPEGLCGAVLTNDPASSLLEKLAGTALRRQAAACYEAAL